MPKWHTGGLLRAQRSPTFPPPCPHRIPPAPPPYPFRGLKCAILAQFGMARTLESRWGVQGFKGSHLA